MSRPFLARCLIVLAFVLICEAATRGGLISPHTLTPPSQMLARLLALAGTADFWSQVGYTATNVLIAFVTATVVGFATGVVLQRFAPLRHAVEPLIASYYALPFFVLYPLFIVLFGMNAVPIVLMGFLYAVMAMITGTLTGLDRIPRVFHKTARTYRMGGLSTALLLQFPAAAPYILTGAKLAFGYAFTGVIGSEFILSNDGLGYGIAYAYNNFDDPTMYAELVFLLVTASVLTMLLHGWEGGIQYRAGAGATGRAGVAPSRVLRGTGRLIPLAVILLAWELLFRVVGQDALASPAMTAAKIWTLLGRSSFWGNVAETMSALGLSLVLSCLGGAALGVALGTHRAAAATAEPLLVALYAMPKVTLYPVVLLFFGIGLSAKVAFGALYGLIPMTIVTLNAVANINPSFGRAARVMNLSYGQLVATVIVPATVPELVSGLRISFSITLLGVMIGEMFASQRGLGFMIMTSMGVNDTSTMMAVTVLIGAFALACNTMLSRLDRHVHRQ